MKNYLTFWRMLDETYTPYDLKYTENFVEITVYGYSKDFLTFRFFRDSGDLCEVI